MNLDLAKFSKASDSLYCFCARQPTEETAREWSKDFQVCYESLIAGLNRASVWKRPLIVELRGMCIYYKNVFETYQVDKYDNIRAELTAAGENQTLSILRFSNIIRQLCAMDPMEFSAEMSKHGVNPMAMNYPDPYGHEAMKGNMYQS